MCGIEGFIRESNMIEGILRPVSTEEILKYTEFLRLPQITLSELCEFQSFVAPGKPLRSRVYMNVRVGDCVAPSGGPAIQKQLELLLLSITGGVVSPWVNHCAYETLHPFLDGNGRTGRALWAWQMLCAHSDPFAIPFLHRFYYQTLEHICQIARSRKLRASVLSSPRLNP